MLRGPADLWLNYIDPRFKARAPVGLTEVPRDVAIEWEGRRIPNNTLLSRRMLQGVQAGQADGYAHAERRGYDAVAQVEAMDQEGIDVAVLFPSRGLFALAVDGMDPELAAAIARAYNEWLAHFCAENPTRLLGAAMLAPHDVDAAVAEARQIGRAAWRERGEISVVAGSFKKKNTEYERAVVAAKHEHSVNA